MQRLSGLDAIAHSLLLLSLSRREALTGNACVITAGVLTYWENVSFVGQNRFWFCQISELTNRIMLQARLKNRLIPMKIGIQDSFFARSVKHATPVYIKESAVGISSKVVVIL